MKYIRHEARAVNGNLTLRTIIVDIRKIKKNYRLMYGMEYNYFLKRFKKGEMTRKYLLTYVVSEKSIDNVYDIL